jgi:Lysozyme inhibitor LprI
MTPRLGMAVLAAAALLPGTAAAGALAECQAPSRDADAVARCLTALDLETLARLKQAEERAAAAARDLDERTKRGNTAYAALAQSSRAFALYQGAQCDYVHATTPGANLRPKSAGPAAADLARIACRIDIARQRIDQLGN